MGPTIKRPKVLKICSILIKAIFPVVEALPNVDKEALESVKNQITVPIKVKTIAAMAEIKTKKTSNKAG